MRLHGVNWYTLLGLDHLWKFVNITIVLIILWCKFFKEIGIIVCVYKILYLLELYSDVRHNLKYYTSLIIQKQNKIKFKFKFKDVPIQIMCLCWRNYVVMF